MSVKAPKHPPHSSFTTQNLLTPLNKIYKRALQNIKYFSKWIRVKFKSLFSRKISKIQDSDLIFDNIKFCNKENSPLQEGELIHLKKDTPFLLFKGFSLFIDPSKIDALQENEFYLKLDPLTKENIKEAKKAIPEGQILKIKLSHSEIYNFLTPIEKLAKKLLPHGSKREINKIGKALTEAKFYRYEDVEKIKKELPSNASTTEIINKIKLPYALNFFGLDKKSSYKDFRKKYKQLSLTYHPDKNEGKNTKIKMQQINKNYGILLPFFKGKKMNA